MRKKHTPFRWKSRKTERKSYAIIGSVLEYSVDYCAALQQSQSTKHTNWVCERVFVFGISANDIFLAHLQSLSVLLLLFHYFGRINSINSRGEKEEKTNLMKWDKERLIFFHLTSEWKMEIVLFHHHHYAIAISIAIARRNRCCTTFTNKWASCEPFRSFKNWNFRCSGEQITHTHTLGSSRSTPNHLLCENEFYWRELKLFLFFLNQIRRILVP